MKIDALPHFPPQKTPKRASGFFLTEVLVSIIVLSFGLLGMVAMQASALKANREARVHSTAVVLARELAEMIRGNKDIGLLARSNPYLGSFKAPFASTDYCLSVDTPACATTTDIAEAQMTEWLARVDAHLPGARVDVCFDTAPFDENGQPQWACTGNGSTIVVKMGWTVSSTNQSDQKDEAFKRAITPSLILPVTLG
jgi:type IV pilus assembly protein PilV